MNEKKAKTDAAARASHKDRTQTIAALRKQVSKLRCEIFALQDQVSALQFNLKRMGEDHDHVDRSRQHAEAAARRWRALAGAAAAYIGDDTVYHALTIWPPKHEQNSVDAGYLAGDIPF